VKLPPELTERRQWVLWRYVQRAGSAKPTKEPYTCMGYRASSTNPQHWSSSTLP
jgi:primase-polymerase (primpol)-like protein